jgi:hypothetical protein
MMFVEDFPERSDADARHDKRGCFGSFAVSFLVRLTYSLPSTGSISSGSGAWLAITWFNHHRLLEPLGYIPPAGAEANHCKQSKCQALSV